MNSKQSIRLITTMLALAGLGFVAFIRVARAESSQTLRDDLEAILSDYSEFIETGNTSQKTGYSVQIEQLYTRDGHIIMSSFLKVCILS